LLFWTALVTEMRLATFVLRKYVFLNELKIDKVLHKMST
jgi:hypothetical protein